MPNTREKAHSRDRKLKNPGFWRKFLFSRFKPKIQGLAGIEDGFLLCVTCCGTAWDFGENGGPAPDPFIKFDYQTKFHDGSLAEINYSASLDFDSGAASEN